MAPIITALISAGAPLLANLVKEKGIEFVNDRFGVNLNELTTTTQGTESLARIEADYRVQLAKIAAERAAAELADTASARTRDLGIVAAKGTNFRADLMFLLAVGLILTIVIMIWKHDGLDEYVKGVFTLVLGRFLGYLDTVYNFEFGTTRSSAAKNATIENLTKGNGNGNG